MIDVGVLGGHHVINVSQFRSKISQNDAMYYIYKQLYALHYKLGLEVGTLCPYNTQMWFSKHKN